MSFDFMSRAYIVSLPFLFFFVGSLFPVAAAHAIVSGLGHGREAWPLGSGLGFLRPSRRLGGKRIYQGGRRSARLAMVAGASTDTDEWVFDVCFTGTGQSSSVPLLKHAVRGTCKVCDDALLKAGSKNKYVGWGI